MIELYQKSLTQFYNTLIIYQEQNYHQLAFIYNNLANVYLVDNDFYNAKIHYRQALSIIENCLNNDKIPIPKAVINEHHYFILYNLLLLAKLNKDNNQYNEILNLLKSNENFNQYDIFYLKHKSPINLKRQLRYFHRCWLFGCETCNNLSDD